MNLYKNSKFSTSQHLVKSNRLNQIIVLPDFSPAPTKENTALDNHKFTNLSKKLEVIVSFKK